MGFQQSDAGRDGRVDEREVVDARAEDVGGGPARQARAGPRRLQRSHSERQNRRRHAHPRGGPGNPRGACATRALDGRVTPRSADRGRVQREGVPRPGRKTPVRIARRGRAAQARLVGRGFSRTRQGGDVGELPVQQGGEKGRRYAGETDGGVVRRLRQRCFRHGAPRRSEHSRHREVRAAGLRRALDGGGDRGAVQGARAPSTSVGGDRRRGESLDQACGPRRPRGKGRPADPGRRYCQYLHARGRHESWQVSDRV